jgi:molecular chaperone GrpE
VRVYTAIEEEKRVSSEAPEEPAKKTAEAESAGGMRDIEALMAEYQALRANVDEMNDRNLRLVAEMENLRRRTERDKSEFAKYAISEFARDVLTVGDNMRRAIDSAPRDAMGTPPALSSLIDGLEMTERELIKVLERYQVKRFDPLGEPFNPHLHEAMTKVDVPNVPADTVIQTIHAGYMIGDRVLRPAAVIVAKGGGVVEQPKSGGEGESVPPGAMRVPNEAAQSSSSFRQGAGGESEFLARTGRMPADESWRPNPNERQEARPEERVAPMRRQQRQGGGNAGGGQYSGRQQAPNQQNQQNNQNPNNRPSTLHKPVIGGGGNTKPDW